MIKLLNTLGRKKEIFKPLNGKNVGIYTCGPTVYDYAHIGNLRAYLFADVLKRALKTEGYKITHIMNITDVGHLTGDRDMGQDKMLVAQKREKKSAWEIASFYTDAFLDDIARLNIITPDKLSKATDHIKDMIELVKMLEKKGFTYKTSDGIYFDTAKLSDYGKLAQLDIEGLKEGARVEANPEKRNPTDFALWKFSPPTAKRDMEWDSPWGIGFPGWHIECSAMSVKYLGQPFDIHTGGIDHVPVHHTNEMAQSEAAAGKPLANFWLHSEFIMVDGGRMGKSEGNLITLDQLAEKNFDSLAYRYFVLQGHYRSKLNFTWDAMDSAQNTLNNLYEKLAECKEGKTGAKQFEKTFFEAINDDLDTPKALSLMWEMIHSDIADSKKYASLMKMDEVLGLSLKEAWERLNEPLPEAIMVLADLREALRKENKWAESDQIRVEIERQGFVVRDTNKGSIITRKIDKN